MFYGLTHEELKGRRPLAKFLAIKLIVMFTFYQSFIVSPNITSLFFFVCFSFSDHGQILFFSSFFSHSDLSIAKQGHPWLTLFLEFLSIVSNYSIIDYLSHGVLDGNKYS